MQLFIILIKILKSNPIRKNSKDLENKFLKIYYWNIPIEKLYIWFGQIIFKKNIFI